MGFGRARVHLPSRGDSRYADTGGTSQYLVHPVPRRERACAVRFSTSMSIEKDSNGIPQVDFRRRTTKINLWMIVLVGAFYIGAVIAIAWFAQNR